MRGSLASVNGKCKNGHEAAWLHRWGTGSSFGASKNELLQLCTTYNSTSQPRTGGWQLEGFVHLGSAPNPAAEVTLISRS